MAKWRAERRVPLDGGRMNPVIEYNMLDGQDVLKLSGWFICPFDPFDPPVEPPTEREMVAAIFRYILDSYTNRQEAIQGEDFVHIGHNDYEIPVGIFAEFNRN